MWCIWARSWGVFGPGPGVYLGQDLGCIWARTWGVFGQAGVGPHLLLGDLHVEDDVVDELGQGLLHRALKSAVLQQRVDKLKDTEHQVLKTQHLPCTKGKDTEISG